ncbi:MAG: hypothetical protein HGJ98_10825 [Desulfosporosinus sp.]|nr:hypothetical protein [Desulfosporosinus sp.]
MTSSSGLFDCCFFCFSIKRPVIEQIKQGTLSAAGDANLSGQDPIPRGPAPRQQNRGPSLGRRPRHEDC